MSGQVVGIDLGGTQMRIAVTPSLLAARRGELSAAAVLETVTLVDVRAAPRSIDEFVDAVVSSVDRFGDVGAIGLTVPGLVDGTTCRWVPNLPFLDGADVEELLTGSGAAGSSVVVGNDAQLSLLAEATFGAVATTDHAVLLAIGTGIGSAVLTAGRITQGSGGGACSFGWACADLDDAGDPRAGWLERHASGTALDRIAAESVASGDGASLVAASRAGDPLAIHALHDAGVALGTALAGAVALLDPAVVVITGGVSQALDVLIGPLRHALDRQLPPHLRTVRVVRGCFGPMAGLVGAILAAERTTTWWDVAR